MANPEDVLLVTNLDSTQAGREVKNQKFLEALVPITDSIRLICSAEPDNHQEKVNITKANDIIDEPENIIGHMVNHIYLQLYLFLLLIRYRAEYETIILFMGYPGAAATGRILRKYVVRFHGGPAMQGGKMEEFVLNLLPNWLAHRIIVPTKRCVEHFNVSRFENKIEYGHFHIDSSFESKVPFDERPRSVGYVGHLTRSKGVDVLIEAIRLVNQKSDKPLMLELGGEGPLSDEIDLDKDYIRYHGWVDHDEIPSLYNQLQLFILLSKSEGLPTVLIESMACGTPVLATPVGGIPDLVQNEYNGLLIERDSSPAEVAETLLELMQSQDLSKMHRSSLETVDEEYRLPEVQEHLQKIILPD